MQLWDLLEGRKLFNPLDVKGEDYDDQTHLAQITALLGPSPNDLLAKGRRTSMFYEADGLCMRQASEDSANVYQQVD